MVCQLPSQGAMNLSFMTMLVHQRYKSMNFTTGIYVQPMVHGHVTQILGLGQMVTGPKNVQHLIVP